MRDNVLSVRKLQTPRDIINYEKLLYSAYKESKYTPEWLLKNYIDTGPEQIRPCIDYEHQIIYIGYEGIELMGAIAINTNPQKYCQLHHQGFNEPQDLPLGSSEILNFISRRPLDIRLYRKIWTGRLFDDLKEKGINKIYASCSYKIVKAYTRLFGFKELGHMGHQKRFLLERIIA